MKIVFSKPELTCVSLEEMLGLARGSIRETNIYPDGTIEIDVVKALTSEQKDKIETTLGLREKK